MLLIGIDEAGYGPKIGPLCHGYAALRCPDIEDSQKPPCLWKMLHPSVMRFPSFDGSITVDDSKKIYSTATGLDLLTHGIRSFLGCLENSGVSTDPTALPTSDSEELYRKLLPEADRTRLEEDEWGRVLQNADPIIANTPVPVVVEDDEDESEGKPKKKSGRAKPRGKRPKFIPCLREALAKSGVQLLALGARALSARHYNRALSGMNKADVNWSVISEQLAKLLALAHPNENIYAVIDRQGGRKFYTGKISALFPGLMAWVEKETPKSSIYRIEGEGRVARVAFFVDADGQNMPVALGSMAAKLTRELCMQRLNAFFRSHVPEIKPTAGYYGDANRFLRETHELRQKLNIDNDALIRHK